MGSQLDKVLIAPNRRDVSWFHGWAKLFRLPNLFTVPGDQLAGYCLAGGLVGGGSGARSTPTMPTSIRLAMTQ